MKHTDLSAPTDDRRHLPEHPDLYSPWSREMVRHYAEKWGDHGANALAVAFAGMGPQDRVLDLGCGTGTAVRAAAERLDGGDVVGVDFSEGMLEVAMEQTRNHPGRDRIRYCRADVADLPLPDGDRGLALAINTLHHWRDPGAVLREVARVLAVGGRLVVCEDAVPEGETKTSHALDEATLRRVLRDGGFRTTDVAIREWAQGTVCLVAAVPILPRS